MGKSKHAEYGRVRIELDKPEPWQGETNFGNPVSITFVSPCILWNDNGYTESSMERLQDYLKIVLGIETLEISKAYLKETMGENYLAVLANETPR